MEAGLRIGFCADQQTPPAISPRDALARALWRWAGQEIERRIRPSFPVKATRFCRAINLHLEFFDTVYLSVYWRRMTSTGVLGAC